MKTVRIAVPSLGVRLSLVLAAVVLPGCSPAPVAKPAQPSFGAPSHAKPAQLSFGHPSHGLRMALQAEAPLRVTEYRWRFNVTLENATKDETLVVVRHPIAIEVTAEGASPSLPDPEDYAAGIGENDLAVLRPGERTSFSFDRTNEVKAGRYRFNASFDSRRLLELDPNLPKTATPLVKRNHARLWQSSAEAAPIDLTVD